MTLTEAKKRGNKKWDKENLRNGSYKMRKDMYAQFEKYCNDCGKSKNGIINELIEEELKAKGYISE